MSHSFYVQHQRAGIKTPLILILFLCGPEAKQVIPEVVGMLPNDDTGTDLPTDVTVSLCHILINLSQSDKLHVKAIVNAGALPKIINISSKDNGLAPHSGSELPSSHLPY